MSGRPGARVGASRSTRTALFLVGIKTLRGTPPRNSSGETYSPPMRAPRCRHSTTRQCPGSSVPMTSPRRTRSPATRVVVTGSNDDSTPPACSIESTGRSTTNPAKWITPSAGARTTVDHASMSIPRCPAAHGVAGAMYVRVTTRGGSTGHDQRAAGAATLPGSTRRRTSSRFMAPIVPDEPRLKRRQAKSGQPTRFPTP